MKPVPEPLAIQIAWSIIVGCALAQTALAILINLKEHKQKQREK